MLRHFESEENLLPPTPNEEAERGKRCKNLLQQTHGIFSGHFDVLDAAFSATHSFRLPRS
jgi:hypothetical protein